MDFEIFIPSYLTVCQVETRVQGLRSSWKHLEVAFMSSRSSELIFWTGDPGRVRLTHLFALATLDKMCVIIFWMVKLKLYSYGILKVGISRFRLHHQIRLLKWVRKSKNYLTWSHVRIFEFYASVFKNCNCLSKLDSKIMQLWIIPKSGVISEN